jgi:hypothetical protein
LAALTTATVELASCGGADAEQERRDAAAERREERQLERELAREEFANPMGDLHDALTGGHLATGQRTMPPSLAQGSFGSGSKQTERRFVALDIPEEFPAQWLHHRGGGN